MFYVTEILLSGILVTLLVQLGLQLHLAAQCQCERCQKKRHHQ